MVLQIRIRLKTLKLLSSYIVEEGRHISLSHPALFTTLTFFMTITPISFLMMFRSINTSWAPLFLVRVTIQRTPCVCFASPFKRKYTWNSSSGCFSFKCCYTFGCYNIIFAYIKYTYILYISHGLRHQKKNPAIPIAINKCK